MAASPPLPPRRRRRILLPLVALLALAAGSISALADFGAGAGAGAGGCPFSSAHHGHDHDHKDHPHHHHQSEATLRRRLPEELAEEEDLKMEAFMEHHRHHHHHHHEHNVPSPLGLWMSAMGCSLLVSMASLICLVLLPVLFLKGKPSKAVVDSLAMFGAGAMLGDAFLHQLPHAFGGGHSHSHDHGMHDHHHHEGEHSHGHSFKDLSVGLSILAGIVLFLLVEKLVRYIEDLSGNGGHARGHGHHHHGNGHNKLKVDDDTHETNLCSESSDSERRNTSEVESKTMLPDGTDGSLDDKKQSQSEASLRKRVQKSNVDGIAKVSDSENSSFLKQQTSSNGDSSSHSSLVFGYLNLFSDGVHNFTDGMALGSAFLLYGPVGGWSRTLFLLAHELPQEIGDFGILVHSGFTVSKALFLNFLSALVALLGTALALLLGKDPGHSSLIEGFTAGGFIYIAVAGVLPEMNNGSTTFRSSAAQLVSLTLGIGVALLISLAE